RLAWHSYGTGDTTVLLMPTWQIVDSRFWKAQVGHLARHFRVVTYDGRGSGDSDRPVGPHHYANRECAEDAVAVLDAIDTERAVVVALSAGTTWTMVLAADHPDRVQGIVAISPAVNFADGAAHGRDAFDERLAEHRDWDRYNRHYW